MNAAVKREPQIVAIVEDERISANRRRRDAPATIRRDDSPLVCDVFSVKEILEANARHDRYYGWSKRWPTIFTNRRRLPETTLPDDRPQIAAEVNHLSAFSNSAPPAISESSRLWKCL